MFLLHSKQDDCFFIDLEMKESSWFVFDGAAKMATDDAVPCRFVQLIKLVPYIVSNVDLSAVLFHGFVCTIDRVMNHMFGHNRFLYDHFIRSKELQLDGITRSWYGVAAP